MAVKFRGQVCMLERVPIEELPDWCKVRGFVPVGQVTMNVGAGWPPMIMHVKEGDMDRCAIAADLKRAAGVAGTVKRDVDGVRVEWMTLRTGRLALLTLSGQEAAPGEDEVAAWREAFEVPELAERFDRGDLVQFSWWREEGEE